MFPEGAPTDTVSIPLSYLLPLGIEVRRLPRLRRLFAFSGVNEYSEAISH